MNEFKPERLKKIREIRMRSAYQLADETQITPSAIYNYEAGTRIPSKDILEKISKVLHIDIDYFYGKEINFYEPEDTLFKIKNLKTKFNELYAPIEKVALNKGKMNPGYMWMLNTVVLDNSNWIANVFIRQENQIEFLNQSFKYLENQKSTYDYYGNIDYLSQHEVNINDITELFNVLNKISRFGLLRLIIQGRKIIKEEKKIIDYDHLDKFEQRTINKIIEGIVIKKRMEQRPHGFSDKDEEYLSDTYGNIDLNEINKALPKLQDPISDEIKKKFDKFINELLDEELL